MNHYMNNLSEKINDMNVRERALIGIVLVVSTLVLWDALLFSSQQAELKKMTSEILITETNLPIQKHTREELFSKVSQDPNTREQIRLERLEKEIERLDAELKKGTIEFISPKQMVEVLKEMINQQSNLELITLFTLDVEAMINLLGDPGDAEKSDAAKEHKEDVASSALTVNVYRHSMEMVLKGDYFSVLEYIKKLENIGWRFEWNFIDIEMEKYPVSNVKIRMSTLSMEEGWIGV